jgi:hypothetical protein
MPHSNQDALIERVAGLPQPFAAKRHLFAAMALDGQILDAAVVMRAIDEWLQKANASPQIARQETWEIEPWLELLPYTTQPDSVIEGLTKVKAFYGDGHVQRWERVLTAVAAVPGAEGEALLRALACAHKDIAVDFEWMRAILGRDTASAVLLYVDLFTEGVVGRGPNAVDAWHLGRELAAYVQKFPQLKTDLKGRYEAATAGPVRTMLEYLFGEVGSEDDLIAMVKQYVATGSAFDGRMDAAVRAVALRHEPTQEGSNSFYIYPATVARVRKFLFELLTGGPLEVALARSCLIAIDVLRDEYGIAANDTRHPDVLSERPWPSEAAEPSQNPQNQISA